MADRTDDQRGNALPLGGVTVLEVGTFLAAPYATAQLADLGARVIKVETPGEGDTVRATGPFLSGHSSPFARLNRNKESVALDLKSSAGREVFLRLAARADVLVENLRPGAMRRLGLGYEDLSATNAGLIYASASGWGQDGPAAGLAGLDIMAQARSGLMSITGEPGGAPVKIGIPVCDLVCALYVAMGVLAALRERDHSGRGQHIDVSLFEAGLSLAVWEAGKWFATGEVGRPQGSAHQSLAPYQALPTADGYVTVGAVTPKTWIAFCGVLGLAELAGDPRFRTGADRHARRDELVPLLEKVTRERSTAALVSELELAGVPCAPIADYGDVFTDDLVLDRNFLWEAPHPVLGSVEQLGSPMRLSRTPCRRGPAGPQLGAHTRSVLAEIGFSAGEAEAMVASGAVATAEDEERPNE